MMATPYENIINLATITLKDWKLDKLFSNNKDEYIAYMSGFMIRNLIRFENCRKDLTNVDETLLQFNEDLDLDEQSIIANYTVMSWFQKEQFDTNQMTGMLGNGVEASRYSEANLFKEKQASYDKLAEDTDLLKQKYGIKHMDITSWGNP